MRSIAGIAAAVLMMFALSACVASNETDPRKGGLFSYNPKAYEERLEERKTTLAQTEADTEKAKQEGQVLEASKQEKIAVQEDVKARLSALYAETGKLAKQLDETKAANKAQETELASLKKQVADLRSQTIKVNNSGDSDPVKQEKITQLKQRMDELLKEAEALSGL